MAELPKILAEPLAAGERTLVLTGNLNDFEMVNHELVYRPSYYLSSLHSASYIILSFAKATPPKIYRFDEIGAERKRVVETYLKQLELYPLPRGAELDDPDKLRIFLSKLRRLLLASHPELSFVLHLDYLEHLCGGQQTGMDSPDQVVMIEFLHSLSISPALRKAGQNLIMAYLYDGQLPVKLKDFFEIELPFPDHEQTADFIDYVTSRDGYAKLAPDLSDERVRALVRGLPLKSSERMFRHAFAQGRPLEGAAVIKQKGESTIKISENTLSPMEAGDLTSFEQIHGMRVATGVLAMYADRLKSGRPPGRSIALIGPPGTCKTLMIYLTAVRAGGYNCLKFEVIKDPLVGESERKVRKACSLAIASAPVILGIDEIDKALPSNQNGTLDGGVSSDQLAQLQYFLARPDLPKLGVFIIATSNAPQNLSTAIQDRFLFLPVLGCDLSEIPGLLRSFVQRLDAKIVDDDQKLLLAASESLYARSVRPRQMFEVVRHCVNMNGPKLKCADIAVMADDYSGQTDPLGVQAAILQSVRMCSFRSWLPWAGNPNYHLPSFLQDIVDLKHNLVDHERLNRKLTELSPYANL